LTELIDQRVHFLAKLSPIVDELRESGICKTLTQTILLGASLGYKYGLREVAGKLQYEVRMSVLKRTPGFSEYATALILANAKNMNEPIVESQLVIDRNVEQLQFLVNSGLLKLAELKKESGLTLSVLVPELIIEVSGIRGTLKIDEIDLPA
jgi:uncharacterized coiled-coil protein SlyX